MSLCSYIVVSWFWLFCCSWWQVSFRTLKRCCSHGRDIVFIYWCICWIHIDVAVDGVSFAMVSWNVTWIDWVLGSLFPARLFRHWTMRIYSVLDGSLIVLLFIVAVVIETSLSSTGILVEFVLLLLWSIEGSAFRHDGQLLLVAATNSMWPVEGYLICIR